MMGHWKVGFINSKIQPQNDAMFLEYVEKTNWYKLNIDSKQSFTLVLATLESTKFIKTFFEGFFSKYPQRVEITEEYMKLRINAR